MQADRIIYKILLFLLLMACSAENDIQRPELYTLFLPVPQSGLIGVVSSDLGNGGQFRTMTLDGVALPGKTTVHADATARYLNGKVYILNGPDQNNIQVLDPNSGFATVGEYTTGSGSNPHDIVLWNDALFVTLYDTGGIGIFDSFSGLQTGSIDLSEIPADQDHSVEPEALFLDEGLLYLAVQRLNRSDPSGTWPPAGTSYLVVIDPATSEIKEMHPFPGSNPFGKFKKETIFGSPHLIIPTPGRLGYNFALDGGISAFNLTTSTFLNRFLYAESTAEGDILDAVVKNENEGYAIVEYADFSIELQKFNPSTGEKIGVLTSFPGSSGYAAGLFLSAEGILYVGEIAATDSGVVLYDTGSGDRRLTPAPVNVGLRPTEILFIE